MSVTLRQSLRVAGYLAKQKLKRVDKFPLLVELEPLFQCNLACSFCGKIQYPEHILKKRMPVDQALSAIEEAGAPMVSIAGGEPLVHPEVHVIASELIKRKKYVFLCTNAILMKKRLDRFKPSPYFSWVVHLDGMRERHDQFVERDGIFDLAIEAIKEAKERGFRVSTNTTFLTTDTPQTVRDVLDYLNDELKVDSMQISPAYAYEKAPGSGALPRGHADPQALLGGVRRRQPQAMAAQPHAALPRLPRGQGRLPVHAVGDPELLDLRLAAALLPDGGRVHRDLQGADRDDRLGPVRARQGRPLCQLHGPLRLRADGGAALDELAARVAARRRRALSRDARA